MNSHVLPLKIREKGGDFKMEDEFKGFWSPSEDKRFSIEEVAEKIEKFISADPEKNYRLIIGTDSHENHIGVVFVSAIVLHRVGNGGRYFWHRYKRNGEMVLRDRIHQEVELSRQLAEKLENSLKLRKENFNGNLACRQAGGKIWPNLEIHVDIGENGETRSLISEIVGMVRAFGFEVKTKPYSYGASTIADRHT